MSLRKTVILADPAARVPWPGVRGRFLSTEPFEISLIDPFFSGLVADRTLIDPPAELEAPPDKAGKPKS